MYRAVSAPALLGLGAAACINAAVAQEVIEEVVVTARQRAETISDVPASITAFSAQDIERAGIERAEDFVLLTPGVSLVNTAEVGDTQLSIRGINGARDGEANFAFIVDGILHTNPSAFNREFADVRRKHLPRGNHPGAGVRRLVHSPGRVALLGDRGVVQLLRPAGCAGNVTPPGGAVLTRRRPWVRAAS